MNRFATRMILVSLIVVALPLACPAQDVKPQGARKFDEFGDIYLTDIKARLDNFAIQLQQEPTARGFIIIYRSRRDLVGLNTRLAARMKYYLVNLRGIDSSRVVTVDGGTADCLTQELWIVPSGATPTPRNDAHSNQFIDTDSAWKFDEYYYPLLEDYDEGDAYAGNSLDAFADALAKYPRTLAYIIAYPQYTRERRADPPKTSARMLRAVKGDLVTSYKIAPSRIRLMNGGYRKLRQIELWVVPRGEHAPIATPNSFPKRRR
jgi:hypothetical protein